MTSYPIGYGYTTVSMDELQRRSNIDKMHPVYADRLFTWIEAQNGLVGIGGSWRADGSQPDKPGFAPEGKSFHQYQKFASGIIAFCAVDLVCRTDGGVHRAPYWSEVPAQGSPEAELWRLHCNVSNEPWHMQPIEIDGWQSWINAGSPDPEGPSTMEPLVVPRRAYDSRNATAGRMAAGQWRQILIGRRQAHVHITVVDPDRDGYLAICGNNEPTPTSLVNFEAGRTNMCGAPITMIDGRLRVIASAACHIIVDVYAETPS
jgi:hypothetical protein